MIQKEDNPQYLIDINNIDKIIDLYEELGQENYIGEKISQVEHAIQASLKAKEYGEDNKCQVAALLHDIGHLIGQKYNLKSMGDLGTVQHELIGAQVLQQIGFSPKVTELVKNHVNAKRYLVTKYPEYHDKLSEASKGTLIHQGGKMSQQEFDSFESNEYLPLILKIRNWDEAAKVENQQLPKFAEFKPLMEQCLLTNLN